MIIKKLLFLLTAVISLGLTVHAQTLTQTYTHAKALYLNGEYEDAISELRRVLFFENNSNPEACLMLGNCYRSMQNNDKSLYYYNLAYHLFSSDSMKLQTKFSIISLYLISDEPNYSLTQLFSLPDNLDSSNLRRKNFYSALACYQTKEYNLSRDYLIKALGYPGKKIENSVDSIFNLAVKNNKFNVYLPMILSIIPGLGQLYLGEYEASANSLMLTGFLAGLYIIAIQNLTRLDAVLSVLPWFERYYQGGLLQAKELAVKKKKRKDDAYYNALIDMYANQIYSSTY